MDLAVYTQILMYISLSCHMNNDLDVLSLFNKHRKIYSGICQNCWREILNFAK